MNSKEKEINMIYTMKDVSRITGLSYDTLKFYCNEGLIPSVKRDSHNHRIFDDKDLNWIAGMRWMMEKKLLFPIFEQTKS